MNDIYTKELRKILTDQSPPPATKATREEIELQIVEISDRLKGPLSNAERLSLVEGRSILRKQLTATP